MQVKTLALPLSGVALALSFVAAPIARSQVPPPAATPIPLAPTGPVVGDMQRLSDGFAQVSATTLPAVVSIRVESTREAPQQMFPFPFGGGGGGDEVVRGTGSGVVVQADGVIVTNNHVIDRAEVIDVHLRDGRVLRARVLGTDPSTDLAVLKVDATGLPTARWADSDTARVGEWVLAIGAPFGLEATVTHGVLSAKGRAGIGANAIEDYLQTDASINPGNSGGPLINLRGEVLGINTMILGRGTGVGFAVPSRIARLVAEQIVSRGEVARGWIGLGLQDIDGPLAEALRIAPNAGAMVSRVEPGTPAARAGLMAGDVITQLDGRTTAQGHDVVREITARRPGERIELTVLREGQSRRVSVTAARRPDERDGREDNPRPRNVRREASPVTLGVEVLPLDPMRARQFGVSRAVVVTAVEPGGAADRSGLRRGDVVLQADGREVAGSGDLAQAVADGRAALLVRRRNEQRFIPVLMR